MDRNRTIRRLLCRICIAALFMAGCGKRNTALENPYPLYSGSTRAAVGALYAENLCVTENADSGTDQVESSLAAGAGVFNLDTKEVLYSQNLFGKLYPASTTKIMTAYVVIKSCNLDDKVTVSKEALKNLADSSVCGLREKDELTVKDLLYGLMLSSGNDAANVLAEHHSGSAEAFAKVMNEEALRLGATGTHFVNPSGLPDENHYTTVYDMYLIFQEAVKLEAFVDVIKTGSIDVTYKDGAGGEVKKTWTNSCLYTNGEKEAPDGFTILGGKTGTTKAAGYCLALYSRNSAGENIVSIVYKAEDRTRLYSLMDQILSRFAK